MTKHVLAIDDEPLVLDVLEALLNQFGCTVTTCDDPVDGVNQALGGAFDLILCDLRMRGKNGAEVTREVMRGMPQAKILLVTAFPGDPLADEALAAGAIGILKKPFEITRILEYLEK